MILGDAEGSYPSFEDGDRGNPRKAGTVHSFFRPFFGGSNFKHLELSWSQTRIMIKIRIASKQNSILLILILYLLIIKGGLVQMHFFFQLGDF